MARQQQGSVVIRGIEFPAGVPIEEIRGVLRAEGMPAEEIETELARIQPEAEWQGPRMTPPEPPEWQGPLLKGSRTWADTTRDLARGGLKGVGQVAGLGTELVHKIPGVSRGVDTSLGFLNSLINTRGQGPFESGPPGLSQNAIRDWQREMQYENPTQELGGLVGGSLALAGPVGATMRGTAALPWLRNFPGFTRTATGAGLGAGLSAAQGGSPVLGAALGMVPGVGSVVGKRGGVRAAANALGSTGDEAEAVLRGGHLWGGVQGGLRATERKSANLLNAIQKLVGDQPVRPGRVPMSPPVQEAWRNIQNRGGGTIPTAAASRTVESFVKNPQLGPGATSRANRLLAAAEAHRAPMPATTALPRMAEHEMRAALAAGGFGEVGRAVPAAASHLKKLTDLTPIQQTLMRAPVASRPYVPMSPTAAKASLVQRGIAPASQLLYRGGQAADSDLVRALMLELLRRSPEAEPALGAF
jgi:hypothetical protein